MRADAPASGTIRLVSGQAVFKTLLCLKDTVDVGTVGEHGLAHLPPCLRCR